MSIAMRACFGVSALLAVAGCRAVEPHSAARSPLAPLVVSPDSVTLEVFSAPAPHDDPQFDELWKLVDEQPLDAELRKRLAANGVRAGFVGPHVPDRLAAALKVTDRRVEEQDRQLVSIDPDGGVVLRLLHARVGKRNELVIPHPRDELSLLEHVEGQVRGKTYRQAECRMALRVFNGSAGEVRLELVPELHYGEFKSRVRASDGMWLWTQERTKKIFHELKLEPMLRSGQMFLVTCRPDRASSAGYHFFTDPSGDKPVPMLWVFRLARAAPDAAFADPPSEDDVGPVTNDQDASL
jgi:hypothetical protein